MRFLDTKGQPWRPQQIQEVVMTRSVSQASAIVLGVAAFISLSSLTVAFADPYVEPAPTPSAPARVATPTPATTTPTTTAAAASLSEPSPTPGWAEAGPNRGSSVQRAGARHAPRHYGYRNANRYEANPVRTAATGVAGGVADLGSIAAYPFYCFPNYGSCSVKVPYRF
jgi:hypothetical protein